MIDIILKLKISTRKLSKIFLYQVLSQFAIKPGNTFLQRVIRSASRREKKNHLKAEHRRNSQQKREIQISRYIDHNEVFIGKNKNNAGVNSNDSRKTLRNHTSIYAGYSPKSLLDHVILDAIIERVVIGT